MTPTSDKRRVRLSVTVDPRVADRIDSLRAKGTTRSRAVERLLLESLSFYQDD